jgi:glucose-1-phosphate thymidylyltransferase
VPLFLKLKPSARGEIGITDLNQIYLERRNLHVDIHGRGVARLDTGTNQSLAQAAQFVSIIENRQGLKIACLEKIASREGFLTREPLEASVTKLGKSSYCEYLNCILEGL